MWLLRPAAAALCTAVTVVGCASAPPAAPAARASETSPVKIELLGFAGCPNTPRMRENLKAALAGVDRRLTLTEIDQEALPAADVRRGYPTPTVLVNGRDLYGLPVPAAPSMACRMYPGGVPAPEELAAKLRAATAPA